MSGPKVHIGELRLRAAGLTREQARHLGEAVAKRLAETGLTSQQSRTIPALDITVRGSASAAEIAAQIRRKLK